MRLLQASLLLGVALASAPASAFVRTRGCDATGEVCSDIAWPTNCASYLLDSSAGEVTGLSLARVIEEIDASFAAWDASAVACSFMNFTSAGTAPNLSVAFDGDGNEDNIIVFIADGWTDLPGFHDPSAIALTSVFFDPGSGTIVNADMEFNADLFEPVIVGEFDGVDPDRPDADILNTMTHEAGHFLGLDHSADDNATMFFAADDAETLKRDLAQDDINGLCAIYPVADDPGECEPAGFIPRRGLFGRCEVEATSPRSSDAAWIALLALGIVWVVRRRGARC